MNRRNGLVYLLLVAVWLAMVVLQVADHRSFAWTSRESLRRHARDLSNSLGVVIRSQRRFGTVPKNRLEGALQGLAEAEEVLGIALFNPKGGVIAQAGDPIDPALGHATLGIPIWDGDTMTVVELAEFGPEPADDDPSRQSTTTLLVEGGGPRGSGGPRHPGGEGEDAQHGPGKEPPPPPEPDLRDAGKDGQRPTQPREPGEWRGRGPDWSPEARERFRQWMDAAREGKRPAYPPWMTAEEYQTVFEAQGLHKLAFRLSAVDVQKVIRNDLRQRLFLALIGLVAVGGLALLYRQMSRSSELELQLVRAEAMNNHLREMNLAAAGLAHETRNPLNVVRGLAQLLARNPEDAAKAQETSGRIVDEVDRVSNRLNEFIAYSKPREPVLAPVDVRALLDELGEALRTDCEDRRAEWRNEVAASEIMADEGMLRQVFFNILMNALQAIPEGGIVRMRAERDERTGELRIAVADSGPGVPEEIRNDVFRPYVSARDKGTGLGLAVVRQIAVAHHWQVSCGSSADLGGAEFVVSGMRVANQG